MDPLVRLVSALNVRQVRFVVIGVGGANYWAHTGGVVFTTEDRDLFLPPDAENLVRAWTACEEAGLELWLTDEPLDYRLSTNDYRLLRQSIQPPPTTTSRS